MPDGPLGGRRGSGEDREGPFLLLQYVDGLDLSETLRSAQAFKIPVPIRVSVAVVHAVAKGLAFLHEMRDADTGKSLGVVHRNVSPNEILVGRDGSVRLGDLGVARSTLGPAHINGELFGKPSYLAPEQAAGEEADFTADIFSCGILLYELTTGRRPYRGASLAEKIELAKRATFIAPLQVNPNLPKPIAESIEKAMQPDRSRRYASTGNSCRQSSGSRNEGTPTKWRRF